MASLMRQLCKAIRASSETPAAIARGSGVDKSQLSRVLTDDQRSLSMDSAERVADYLGFRMVLTPKRRRSG